MPAIAQRTAAAPQVTWSVWDGGRMRVNNAFADLLKRLNWVTFDVVHNLTGGEIVRKAGPRVTRRLVVGQGAEQTTLYLKCHAPVKLGERVKPWLRLNSAVLGARPEWNALLKFHAAGLPTVTPVAFGECGDSSWLLTESLDHEQNLLEWTQRHGKSEECDPNLISDSDRVTQLRKFTVELAELARRMHDQGLHHQDFYLNHILIRVSGSPPGNLHVIDLGRVREQKPLSQRWILKDLSQLNYSARHLPCRARLRFLRTYLDRPFNDADRRLIWWLEQKAAQIARHSAKHRL